MPSTAGEPAFLTAKAKRTAPLIEHLTTTHGMILLGKANLTDFCGMKMPGLTPGWSPVGGQTQNPYVYGGLVKDGKVLGHSSPGGSSAGSAVGVAAGFAPLSIGTEAVGSVITPANRAGLYALKCSVGSVDGRGGFRYTDVYDCVGGMAKSVEDLKRFVAAMMGREETFEVGEGFGELRVAFTDPEAWLLPEGFCEYSEEVRREMVSRSRT